MLLKGEKESNLITCIEHIDEDNNMLCDVCSLKLPLSNYFENQVLENKNASGENIISVAGKMPKDTNLSINEIGKEEANSLTNQLTNNNVEIKSIEGAYDISLIYNEEKFQPEEYNNSVKVKLSNLELDETKAYALLHIKDDGNYEILPVKILNNNELEFKATSFSVYILVTVGTNTVTFSGDGNYTIFDENLNEITDGMAIADGTNFTFTIVPNDGYGITGVTSLYASGDSAVTITGYVKGREGNIASVSEDLVIEITTALAPVITTQPVSVKVAQGGTATFTVAADNATTYYWEYRENRDTYWKAAGSTSATLSLSDVLRDKIGYEYRCLVGNNYYQNHDAVKSDVVKISVADDDIIEQVKYLKLDITAQPESQKVKLGDTATFTIATNGVTTYKWQYQPSGETFWLDASAIGSGYNTRTLTVDTSSVTLDENLNVSGDLVGAMFRCVVSNSSVPTYTKNSDVAVLSVAQDEYASEGIKVSPNVNNATVTVTLPDEERIYNGTAHKPVVTVKDGDTLLTLGTDYTVTYGENINAGTGTITITGAGDYTGTRVVEFEISPATVAIPTGKTLTYTGSVQTGVEAGTEYTVTGNTGTAVGDYEATATLVSTQNYKWSDNTTEVKKIAWEITPALIEIYAPTDFTASSGDSSNSIILTWSDSNTDIEVAYVIQVLNASGDWETISTNATSPFEHDGLTENTAYEYNIRAYNDFRGYTDYVYTEGFTKQLAEDVDFIKDTVRPVFTNIKVSASSNTINSNGIVNISFESFDENYNSGETTLSADTIIIKVGDEIIDDAIIEMSKVDVVSGERFSFNLRNVSGAGTLSLVVPVASVKDKVGHVNLETEIPTSILVDDEKPANVNNFKASGDSDLSMVITFENPDPSNKVVLEELNEDGEWVILSENANSSFTRPGLEEGKTYEYRVHTVSETGKESDYAYTTGTIPYDDESIIIRNDTIAPVLTYVGINPDDEFINSKDTLILTIDATDANYNYNESDILPEDIIVMVSGEINNNATSTITKVSTANGERYEITIKNITGIGELSVAVSGDSIIDKAGNGNINTQFDLTPYVANGTVSDTAPDVEVDGNELIVTNKQESIYEIVDIKYLYRESGETEFKVSDDNVIEDVASDTYYEVKTVVTDEAGNTEESQITIVKTEPMDGSMITITADVEYFTSGDVNVTINYGGSKFIREYSIDGTTWHEAESDEITVRITKNTTVYARLSDGKISTDSVSYVVDNIDKEKPVIGNVAVTPAGKANSKDMYVSGVEDVGVSGVRGYYISTVIDLDVAVWTEFTGTEFTYKVTENGTHYVWVIDNAGNISAAKIGIVNNIAEAVPEVTIPDSIEVEVGERVSIPMEYTGEPKDITYTSENEDIVGIEPNIKQVVGVSSGDTIVNITITNYDGTTIEESIKVIVKPVTLIASVTINGEDYNGEWTNQDVEVTLSTSGVSPSDYDVRVDDDDEWSDIDGLVVNSITGKGEITYSADFSGEVYYIGYNSDGNVITTETTGDVIKVDKTAPTMGRVDNDVRTNSMIVEIVGATDDLSGIKEYEIGIYLDDELLATYTGESGEVTFSGLVSSTTYGIKYKITDNAGNTTESIDGGTFTTGEVIRTVTYDYLTNGGESVDLESEERVAGTQVDLSIQATKTGYVFKGWARTADGEVLTSLVMPEEDITLYAIFKDESAPTVSDKDYETVDGELEIIAKPEDDGSGVKDYAVTTDEGTPTEWFPVEKDENGEIRIPVPGTNKYYVWIRDIEGNYVMYEQVAIKDIFAPTGTIYISGDNRIDDLPYSQTQNVMIDITAEDNECEPEDIKVAIYNEEDYKNITAYTQIKWDYNYQAGGIKVDFPTTAGDGLKRIYIIFKDKAGNISMTIKEIQ